PRTAPCSAPALATRTRIAWAGASTSFPSASEQRFGCEDVPRSVTLDDIGAGHHADHGIRHDVGLFTPHSELSIPSSVTRVLTSPPASEPPPILHVTGRKGSFSAGGGTVGDLGRLASPAAQSTAASSSS